MLKPTKQQRVVSVTTIVITTMAVLLGVENTLAQEPQQVSTPPTSQLTSARMNMLESAFWVCDYLATTQGATDTSTCAAVYEELKDRKFAGDFDALVSWWRQNKVAQHQNIAVERVTQPSNK